MSPIIWQDRHIQLYHILWEYLLTIALKRIGCKWSKKLICWYAQNAYTTILFTVKKIILLYIWFYLFMYLSLIMYLHFTLISITFNFVCLRLPLSFQIIPIFSAAYLSSSQLFPGPLIFFPSSFVNLLYNSAVSHFMQLF